jgi:hypothetical protein
MKILSAFQSLLNRLASHPLSLGVAVGFLIGWTAYSILSNGKFDPGLGIENLIINGLSILLLFAANSKSTAHAEASEARHDAINERLDALHEHIEDKLGS